MAAVSNWRASQLFGASDDRSFPGDKSSAGTQTNAWRLTSRISTNGYPYPVRSTTSINIDACGRTRQTPRGLHLFWPARPFRENYIPPRLRAAARPRRPNMPALARGAGHRDRLQRDERSPHRGSQTKAQIRQSPGPSTCLSSVPANWRRPSTRSCAPVFFIISRTPMRAQGSRGVLEPDGAMHLMVYAPTDGPASTCCRSSATARYPCHR